MSYEEESVLLRHIINPSYIVLFKMRYFLSVGGIRVGYGYRHRGGRLGLELGLVSSFNKMLKTFAAEVISSCVACQNLPLEKPEMGN